MKFTIVVNYLFQAAAIVVQVANMLITNPSITPSEHKLVSGALVIAQGLLALKAHYHEPTGEKIETPPK